MAKEIKVNPLVAAGASLEFKTLDEAFSQAVNGDTILLRAGYFHAPLRQPVTKQITIKRYVDQRDSARDRLEPLSNPCIDGLIYADGGTDSGTDWTPMGQGVWRKSSTTMISRLWRDMQKNGNRVGERSMGSALRRCPNLKDVAGNVKFSFTEAEMVDHLVISDSDWASGLVSTAGHQNDLYVRTGSDVKPPEFFHGLGWQTASSSGMAYGFDIRTSVTIEGIDVRGCTGGIKIVADTANPLSNISISNCKLSHMSAYAVRIHQDAAAASISGVTVKNCTADLSTSPREQERDVTTDYLGGGNDMFTIAGPVKDVMIENCTSINASHVAFLIGSIGRLGPSNSGYRKCKAIADEWTSYTRGTTSYQCEDSCYIEDCTFIGMNVRSQFAGKIKVTGCQWLQARKSIRKANTDGWFVIETYAGVFPENVRISNCLFTPCFGVPIEFNAYDTSMLQNTITVENNLMLDTERIATEVFVVRGNSKGSRVERQTVRGNVIAKVRNADAKVDWHGEVIAINNTPGFDSNVNAGLNWPHHTLSTD